MEVKGSGSTLARSTLALALLSALLLAITLTVAALGIRNASVQLARGQAEMLIGKVHQGFRAEDHPPEGARRDGPPPGYGRPPAGAPPDRPNGRPPHENPEVLRRIFAQLEPEGLRYLAIVANGEVLVGMGERMFADVPITKPGELIYRAGETRRAQLLVPLPAPPGRPQLDAEGGGIADRRPWIVIEFVPQTLDEVNAAMNRALAVGALAIVVLLAAGILGVRSDRRHEALRQVREVEQRLAELGRMSSMISHELRNPLAALKGHAQLLAESLQEVDSNVPHQQSLQQKAQRVVAQAERLERLTTDLLQFVSQSPLSRSDVPLRTWLAHWLETRSDWRDGEMKKLQRVRLEAPEVLVSIDPANLLVAVDNLVRNAEQASDGKPVQLRASVTHNTLTIEVQDEGPGLPLGQEERIFEPFVSHHVKGTGLGLAIARRAAHQHGGSLTGMSLPKRGALFRLVVPCEKDVAHGVDPRS